MRWSVKHVYRFVCKGTFRRESRLKLNLHFLPQRDVMLLRTRAQKPGVSCNLDEGVSRLNLHHLPDELDVLAWVALIFWPIVDRVRIRVVDLAFCGLLKNAVRL